MRISLTAMSRAQFSIRPMIVAAIITAGLFAVSCGGSPAIDEGPGATRSGTEYRDQALEITTYPVEGELLADLSRPIVVEFSDSVEPEVFSYRLSPDSAGWSEAWAPGNRRVVLAHASPLIPFETYEFEVSVAPSARTVTRFATQGPTSLELIECDEADGVIDLDTAWTYRMHFIFEADALPNEYRSATPVRDVDAVMRDFLRVRSTLSPETLARLRPYTVRPDHPDSVFARHLQGSRVAASSPARSGWVRAAYADEPPQEDGKDESWSRPTGMRPEPCSPRIVIWSAPEEESVAREACRQIQNHTMFEDFEKLLGRKPVEDIDVCQEGADDLGEFEECVEARGGDERLDIYLVPQGYVVKGVGPWAGLCFPEDLIFENKATAFILVKPNPKNIEDFASTIAHEIFHAFQYAFNVNTDSWWIEATATWAEEYIHPAWRTENDLPPAFSTAFHSQEQLTFTDGKQEYAMYLFPYYLEKVQPGSEQVIADIWKACESEESLDAIDGVLGGDFDQTLKDFAVANFDLEPHEDEYGQPLPLYEYHGVRKIMLDHDEGQALAFSRAISYLSAEYQVWTQDLNPNITPLVRFELDDFAGNDKLLLHAIIYTNGDVREEDWSDLDERVFCINREDDSFDQIALITVLAERPPEPAPEPENPEEQRPPTPNHKWVRYVVSLETEGCRPLMGTGRFTIELDTREEDLVSTYSFTERVTAEVEFDEFDPGNAEYRGRARVLYKEHIEKHVREAKGSHVDWTKDTVTDKQGRGEVECSLYYPWGQEGATYNLACGEIEIDGKTYEVTRYTTPPDVKEIEHTWTETTDIDESHISSYYGGLPSRYDLVIEGQHLDADASSSRTTRDFSSWRFTLSRPPE